MVRKKDTSLRFVQVLECDNEGGTVFCFVGGGVVNSAWFLHNFDGGIEGVVGS